MVLLPLVKLLIFLNLHRNLVFLLQGTFSRALSGSSLLQLVQDCILPKTELWTLVQSPI